MSSDIRYRPEGALLRTYLSTAGVSPESIEKPLIGVATVSTQVFSEKPDARDLGTAVCSGVESAGGIAVRWDTVRTPELMSYGHAESYSFAWRDQLADLIESWARQEALDGLVLVGDAPETLIGMAMAAARLNLPAIIVTTGHNRWEFKQQKETVTGSRVKKESADPFERLSETLFAKKRGNGAGKSPQLADCLLTQDDHATYAVDLVLEALGVCLPGISTAPVQSVKRHELANASGQRIINLVKSGYVFRRVLSLNAFTNAIRLNAAMGGSVDVAVHLMALAHEAGLHIGLDFFDKIARETPQICDLTGRDDKEPPHTIEDLDLAGGVWAVLHAFKSSILPTTTINGRGALDLCKSTLIKDTHVITAHRPYSKQSGVGILKGNLALRGAVYLLNQIPPGLARLRGPAVVFENETDAAKALSQGALKKGCVLFVRGQGPKGGPGLRKLRILPALLQSRGLNKTIPLITDGRLPDTPQGLFVSFVSPEAALMGPLGVLKNGDLIDIDLGLRQLNVRLTDMDLRIRLARWQTPESKLKRGFLERYSRSVSEANEGAVLK
jgi:dihydroxy-acid dehydratase